MCLQLDRKQPPLPESGFNSVDPYQTAKQFWHWKLYISFPHLSKGNNPLFPRNLGTVYTHWLIRLVSKFCDGYLTYASRNSNVLCLITLQLEVKMRVNITVMFTHVFLGYDVDVIWAKNLRERHKYEPKMTIVSLSRLSEPFWLMNA